MLWKAKNKKEKLYVFPRNCHRLDQNRKIKKIHLRNHSGITLALKKQKEKNNRTDSPVIFAIMRSEK